jgi:hypothetical protein
MVGVSVFGKEDHVPWILEGIRDCFPEETHTEFYFEACTDQSVERFVEFAPKILGPHRTYRHESGDQHIFEQGCHRHLVARFITSNCDYLIVPHDDNKFLDPVDLVPSIERVMDTLGEKLGWIGCRDGYDYGYANMISSEFSTSDIARAKIANGQFVERKLLNTGPMIYTRQLIEKIGLPDPDLKWFWWDDYCCRASAAGLTNVLLGMNCAHTKFGKVQPMPPGLYDGNTVAKDLETFRNRWRPVLGHNPV